MKSGPVILYLLSQSFASDGPVCASRFVHHGLAVTPCATLAELTRQVWAMRDTSDSGVVAIIDGRDQDAALAVSSLRALRTALGIVALVNADNEAGIIHLLRTGVDVHCFLDASPDLLAAIVLRLLWRLGAAPSTAAGPLYNRPQLSWEFVDQGWVLRSPAGRCVTLTTGERAFLTTLLNAPSRQAGHQELIDAVNASYNNNDGRTHQSRLGVMVSRMRRKFKQAGTPLPLKSVHNWGYMFVDDS